MPKTKRAAPKKQTRYRCVKMGEGPTSLSFDYAADATVRQRRRDGEKIPRGALVRYEAGDELRESDLPPEVFAACIRRGLIEPVGAKEASDDAER